MPFKKAALLFLTAVLWGGWTSPSRAFDLFPTDPEDYIKSRTYAAAMGIFTTIDDTGDFNGSLSSSATIGGFVQTNLYPAITRNLGFGGLLGYRQGAYAAEISYWRSEHEAQWGGILNGIAYYESIDVNFKRYFFTKLPTQPFVSFGMSFPWLVVKDGSNWNTLVDDASMSGIGANLGAGLELYFGEDYSLFAGTIYRWAGISQVTGAAKDVRNITIAGEEVNLAANGLNFYLGASIGFK